MDELIQRLQSLFKNGFQPSQAIAQEAADQLEANAALIALLRASLRKVGDEVEGLRKDAERYRFLTAHWGHRTPILNGLFPKGVVDDAFDAGIDAAIAALASEKEPK